MPEVRLLIAGGALALLATSEARARPTAPDAQRAHNLIAEGARQLEAKALEQALANFLEAYATLPSPRTLLEIASTLRDMGRHADAANTYQRYLLDPATGGERAAEIRSLLVRLDEELTVLTIRVAPPGADLSIDGGPFTPVGRTLVTRVRPGLHLVRIRRGDRTGELTVHGFEGEHKEVAATLEAAATAPAPAPDHVELWLGTGTLYGTEDARGNQRRVRTGFAGPTIAPILPPAPAPEPPDEGIVVRAAPTATVTSGVLGVVRIDGKGRGFAGGAGITLAFGRVDADLLVLRSSTTGGYLGARYRLRAGTFRPYLAAGVPGFIYDHVDRMADTTTTRLAIGVRGAAGVEIVLHGHLGLQADLGYERFFALAGTPFDAGVFVPTVGVIGRL